MWRLIQYSVGGGGAKGEFAGAWPMRAARRGSGHLAAVLAPAMVWVWSRTIARECTGGGRELRARRRGKLSTTAFRLVSRPFSSEKRIPRILPTGELQYGENAMAGDRTGRMILDEVARLIESLLETGEGGSIEVTNLSLSEDDYDLLDEALGRGAVSVEVAGAVQVQAVETGIAGVWWITHLNAEDEIMAEFIEVAFCPEILLSPEEEVADGLAGLRARLFEVHLSERADRRRD